MSISGQGLRDGFETGLAAGKLFLALDPRLTVIFAANDIMATAVMKATSTRGVHVPRDISVVGFDGSFIAAISNPALTTVFRPMTEMASLATHRLLDLLHGVETPSTTKIALSLVLADSTAPAR